MSHPNRASRCRNKSMLQFFDGVNVVRVHFYSKRKFDTEPMCFFPHQILYIEELLYNNQVYNDQESIYGIIRIVYICTTSVLDISTHTNRNIKGWRTVCGSFYWMELETFFVFIPFFFSIQLTLHAHKSRYFSINYNTHI